MDSQNPIANPELVPGTPIANYVIEALIGQGAQGSVYLARDTLLGRRVALKTLRSGSPGETRAVEEARLLAGLEHPNLVRVYHATRHQGTWFIVSEYLSGGSLTEMRIREGRLLVSQALDLVAQAARGMAYAHSVGVLHRDIKPDNMLLSAVGEVKLADFGLAQVSSVENPTVSGQVGTPAFRAPELSSGGSAVPATDVYSLGASLFYLLTGRPPALLKVSENRRGADDVEASLPSDIPEAVRGLLARMLAASPKLRPPSHHLPRLLASLACEPTRSLAVLEDQLELPEPLTDVGSIAITCQALGAGPDKQPLAELLEVCAGPPVTVLLSAKNLDHLVLLVQAARERWQGRSLLVLREVLAGEGVSLKRQCCRSAKLDANGTLEQALQRLLPRGVNERSLRLLEVHVQGAISGSQWQEFCELTSYAVERGICCLLLSQQSVPRALIESSYHPPAALRQIALDKADAGQRLVDMRERLTTWLFEATSGQFTFTEDALLLGAHLCAEEEHNWSKLAHHSLLIAVAARLPVVTSWAILGASRAKTRLEKLAEVPHEWRRAPRTWPTSEHASQLRQLRSRAAGAPTLDEKPWPKALPGNALTVLEPSTNVHT